MAMSLVAFGLVFVSAMAFKAPESQPPKPTLPRTCPEFKGMPSLNLSKIEGVWFAVSGAEKGFETDKCRCIKATINTNPDGSVESTMSGITSDNKTSTMVVHSIPLKGKPSTFSVKHENGDGDMTSTVTIIYTDYTDCMVTALCVTYGQTYGYMINIYGRGKTFTAEKSAMIKKDLKLFHNITDVFTPIEQNC